MSDFVARVTAFSMEINCVQPTLNRISGAADSSQGRHSNMIPRWILQKLLDFSKEQKLLGILGDRP